MEVFSVLDFKLVVATFPLEMQGLDHDLRLSKDMARRKQLNQNSS